MALIYKSEITPSKLELVQGWITSQRWFVGDPAGLAPHAAFRFDDPEGEVGVESLLLHTSDGQTLQVPLTYRGAPLAGGEAHLVGEMEHSRLGHRWVYDGAGDPACIAAFATAARTGGREADLVVDGESGLRPPTARVAGSGSAATGVEAALVADPVVTVEGARTVSTAGGIRLALHRFPAAAAVSDDAAAITGTWAGQPEPALLAEVAGA
jgi:hypothetical protein